MKIPFLSFLTTRKNARPVSGNAYEAARVTESAIIYDPVGEFTINAVLLDNTDLNAVEGTVKTWCSTEATNAGMAAGGSVIITEKKVSQKIEDAQTVDISAKYLPYCKAEQ